ncbi:MAG: DNA mismatch repair endonuclease MutL [Clostridiales bacterium]|nr:DNA mismatch repair endonuclease MutL [Clostridiales bacterium]
MTEIQVLSPHVADLIAAGEVVDRPASVVKELVENAFDAGARHVTVELRGGGTALIRVRDDGKGMSPEDAGVAFLRHATSKLRDAAGLERIATMGFRGEALAAISAVSRIELLTRQRGADTGVRVTLEAGDIQELGPAGCAEGTVMTVCDLFYNTPARQKFLKSDRAEGAACVTAALRAAMGRPDVSVRCVRDGEEVFFTAGDGRLDSVAYSLLGRDLAAGLLPCRCSGTGVQVEGLVSAPNSAHGNRTRQYFFVNGRPIRSLCLQAALEQAYHNRLMSGRFPACILYVTVSPAAVDVNVHPAKTEVKFVAEKAVFDAVYGAVSGALSGGVRPDAPDGARTEPLPAAPGRAAAPSGTPGRTASPAASAAVRPAPRPEAFSRMSSAQLRAGGTAGLRPARPAQTPRFAPEAGPLPAAEHVPAPEPPAPEAVDAQFRPQRPAQTPPPGETASPAFPAPKVQPAAEPPVSARPAAPARAPQPAPEQQELKEAVPRNAPPRVVGEVMGVYIVAEWNGRLLLIDKHAAHERLLFDQLRAGEREIVSQQLLEPVVLTGPDAALLLEHAALLSRMGIEVEPFGADALAARALPADTDPGEGRALLEECAADLRRGASPELRQDAVLRTVACKAAVKAGRSSDPAELQRLADAAASGRVRFCPHGRPVSFTMTREELDQRFRR